MPGELHDRAADNWRPLLAIADLAGGEWPGRARHAALVMAGANEGEDGSLRTLLLRDIRDLFTSRGVARLRSEEIVEALVQMEDRPWSEWGRGRSPMTTPALAKQLKPFKVKPRQFKHEGKKIRGYEFAELNEVFTRYLPPEGGATRYPRYVPAMAWTIAVPKAGTRRSRYRPRRPLIGEAR